MFLGIASLNAEKSIVADKAFFDIQPIVNTYYDDFDYDIISYNVAAERLWTAISDAMQRYKILNSSDYVLSEGKDFILSLLSLCEEYTPAISLHDDSIDVVLKDMDNREITLNYDFDDAEVVYVTFFQKVNGARQLVIKDCLLTELYDYLETV